MGPSSLPSSDSELVRLALEGQSQAFGELYNRYLSSVYDFLYRVTRNAEEAADLAQETFLKAMENLRGLQNPARFKSWLFSIAHHGALNRLERRKREVPPSPAGESGEDGEAFDPLLQQVDPHRLANPEQAAEARESASLVWEAAASLDPRTYAVLDLHVRQGLESAEIAEVLGVSKGNAYTMLNRMKKSVQEAIGTFLLARRGSKDCDQLQAILAPVSIPPVTPELRRAIDRHVRRCDVCSRRRRALLTPIEVFGALAAVPTPIGLQGAIWGELEGRWPQAQAEGIDAASGGEPAGAYGSHRGDPTGADGGIGGIGGLERQDPAGTASAAAEGGKGGGGLPPIADGESDGWGLWSSEAGWGKWFQSLRLRLSRRTLAIAVAGAAVLALVPAAVALSLLLSGSDDTPGSPLSGTLDEATATAVSASLATPAPFAGKESTTTAAPATPQPPDATGEPPDAQTADRDGDGMPDSIDECPEAPEAFNGYEDEDGCPDEVPDGEVPEEVPDRDGDGMPDSIDECPEAPETFNGYEDEDGCPDEVPEGEVPEEVPDRDGDGLPDNRDECPEEPETFNGYEDEDGCPDEIPDWDGDGIPNASDGCPNQPETFNGYEDEDGCPDEIPDWDGDGIPNASDGCPNQPEDWDGHQDSDGCPDPDNDGDGIPDTADHCPNQPETFNDYQDEDGCPDLA